MSSVSIVDVRKNFGAVQILKGVSFDIADGEFVILVGPSGCGKSTLLRMLAGLEKISSGEMTIDGHVVNDLPPKDRDIAMVFQNYALYPHMTVAENMAFSLRMRDASAEQIKSQVDRAAKILGLGTLLERHPRQLSGGQRQRVAMGRAIVRDPKVFLFDEPLSNLDAKLRVAMRAEIKELHQRLKTTTIYVTHDQIEAMTMASKIVVMRDGSIEQMGAPLDLYDRPDNMFVAGFIGSPSMNFLPGRCEGRSFIADCGLVLPMPPGASLGARRAVYGVRPEHFSVKEGSVKEGSVEPDGAEVEVAVVEPTGAETQIVVRKGEQDIVCVFRDRVLPDPGTMISIRPDATRAHLFDEATGKRIRSSTPSRA
jgi:multiple sugar transport system ATP-binding protein